MHISELNTYPVKSFKGISHHQIKVGLKGPEWDRRWMVVNPEGGFVSQRQFPQMALVEVSIDAKGVTISFPGRQPLKVEKSEIGARREVTVWNSICRAIDQGEEAQKWLTEVLGIDCSLVYLPEDSVRNVNPGYARKETDQLGFADAYPFLLISEASLEELNSRLEVPIPMNRFRPNLVVRGAKPFEEDTWKTIQIGDMLFDLVKPCSRCVVTCTDQTTAERGVEPLKTLAEYRKFPGGIMFGQNTIHHGPGVLKVGDSVKILEFKN